MTLYKYVSAERLDILQENRIRFTPASLLNDPFEMTAIFDGLADGDIIDAQFFEQLRQYFEDDIASILPPEMHEEAWQYAQQQMNDVSGTPRRNLDITINFAIRRLQREFTRLMQEHRENIGVLSLSECSDNLLMWSHYADEHRGFVIAIDETHPALNEQRTETDEFHHPRRVLYADEKPVPHLMDMDGTSLLLTKSRDWAYEQEWRVIKPLNEFREEADIDDEQSDLFILPADAIEGVILGARVPEGIRRSLQILIQIEERYHHTWLQQAELQERSFGLNILPLPSNAPSSHFHENLGVQLSGDYPDEETAYRVGQFLLALARYEHAWPLDLGSLTAIFVVDDLDATIQELTNGSDSANAAGGHSYYTIGGYEGDNFNIALYLNRNAISPLMGPEDENEDVQPALHFVHRGLAHAHDLAQRQRMFGTEYLTTPYTGAAMHLIPCVKRMWTQYIAAFMTIETTNRDTSIALLIEVLDTTSQLRTLTENSIERYRSHADLNLLFNDTLPTLGLLFDRMGRLIGYLHAAGLGLNDLESEQAIDDSFTEVFDEASAALERMRLFYPEWQGPEIYDPLVAILEWYFFTHGIGFTDNEDGIYCAVP